MTNLADVLLAPARTTPDAVALRAGPDTVTYRELESRAARVAGALRSQGVDPGARVTIEGRNTIAFVASYLGVLWAGAVAVPLNPHAPDPELDREIATAEPAVVLGSPSDEAGGAEPVETVARDDSDVAVLLFTAGTAGAPKAAMLTHGNLASNIRQVLDHPGLALNAGDVSLGVLPLFHVFGLNAVLGIGLAAGASTVLLEQFEAAGALHLMR
ncbi:MAG TPA: AMP-binding protein, partial [Acidimicrobiia bacterium]|nr:AMP-binding protein [Acidimicrobiia bacterium]